MLEVVDDLPAEDFPEPPPGTAVYYQVPFTTVPDVTTAASITEAVDAVYAVGLEATVDEIPSSEAQGTILGTRPLIGTALRQGTSVVVEVASGAAPEAEMPNLIGLATGQVTGALDVLRADTGLEVGWVVRQMVVTDSSQWGTVVSTDPPPGGTVADGQTITVFVGVRP